MSFCKSVVLGCVALVVLGSCRPASEQGGEPSDRPARMDELPRYAADVADAEPSEHAQGQVLYVPVYSHIFHIDDQRTFDLSATLSIRNVDLSSGIKITAADYYDSDGGLVRRQLQEPRYLEPLASMSLVVDERDRTGGVGANFVVEWRAERPVVPPVVESVMISTAGQQGVSFTSRAEVVRQW